MKLKDQKRNSFIGIIRSQREMLLAGWALVGSYDHHCQTISGYLIIAKKLDSKKLIAKIWKLA